MEQFANSRLGIIKHVEQGMTCGRLTKPLENLMTGCLHVFKITSVVYLSKIKSDINLDRFVRIVFVENINNIGGAWSFC